MAVQVFESDRAVGKHIVLGLITIAFFVFTSSVLRSVGSLLPIGVGIGVFFMVFPLFSGTWRYELYDDGTLRIYKRHALRGEYRLPECMVTVRIETTYDEENKTSHDSWILRIQGPYSPMPDRYRLNCFGKRKRELTRALDPYCDD